MKVLETDQWTSTGNVSDFGFHDFNLDKIHGGDADAVKNIFGGSARIKEVPDDWNPPIGSVWFIEDPETQKFKLWKCNYDSSG
jgi:hypothetical protein